LPPPPTKSCLWFQPYMVIRLANKKENKCTVAFRTEISML
jgi:hypothetical protein